jgi:hypothetical protein
MNNRIYCACIWLFFLNLPLSTVLANGTAFTYQGQLQNNGSPVSGTFDLKFSLYNSGSAGAPVAGPITNAAATVSNGLFTVPIDFGPGIFVGPANWLEISVETNGGSFTTLAPRQQLTPAPYAIYAENASAAGITGTLPAASLGGTYGNPVTLNNFGNSFTGNGAGLTSVNAATLGGLGIANFWQLGGNSVSAGQFLGSLNNQPVKFWANNARALRLEPGMSGHNSPNVIGGSTFNYVSAGVSGATIGGGGGEDDFGDSLTNSVGGSFGTVSGGYGNTASGYDATVGGGNKNLASGLDATIAGGYANMASATYFGLSTVGGGQFNTASGDYSTISGGAQNTGSGTNSFIGGGQNNTASTNYATIAGGWYNTANGNGATVGGGSANIAAGQSSVVAGGQQNASGGDYSSVAGGINNNASVANSTIGGGQNNYTSGSNSTVAGGSYNTAMGNDSTVIGGSENTAEGAYSTVAGGSENAAYGPSSFAAGSEATASYDGSFVWADDTGNTFSDTGPDQFCIRAAGGLLLNVSGSSGLHPAACQINSTSANGVGLFVAQSSSDAAAVFVNTGAGDIIKGFSGGTGGNLVFEVVNSGTVYAKGVALTSDRNAKEHFAPLDSRDVLAKVAALPISEWNYKDNAAEIRHVGPMAQDFHAAFGLDGADDKHISVVDEGGVALAAIQGLNQKLEEESQAKDEKILALEKQLHELQAAVNLIRRDAPTPSRGVSPHY